MLSRPRFDRVEVFVRPIAVLPIALILLTVAPAAAMSDVGAIILEFNTSVRAEGMGSSGVATHWGGDPGSWANPGLLAYQEGLRFSKMESRLAPDLADEVWLRDERVTFGVAGFGLLYDRGPLEGTFLVGFPQGTDDAGNSTGTNQSWMKAERIGAGVSLFRFLESVAGQSDSSVSKMLDVSVGYTYIAFEDQLAPDEVLQDGSAGPAKGDARSFGTLIHFTPLNTVGPTYAAGPLGGVRLSLAYGQSLLNDSTSLIVHTDTEQRDPFPRKYVRWWSAHVETGFPPDLRAGLRHMGLGRLVDSLTPLVSYGYTNQSVDPGILWDVETQQYNYEHDTSGLFNEESTGWELTVANIWTIRRGHLLGAGDIDGDTEGNSLGFKLAGVGGMRWDKATVPQVSGLSRVEREAWTVWVDLSSLMN